MCHHLLLAQFTCSDVSDFLSSTVSLPGLLSCFPLPSCQHLWQEKGPQVLAPGWTLSRSLVFPRYLRDCVQNGPSLFPYVRLTS